MQKRTEKVKDEQRGGKKEVSREEESSVGTLSNTQNTPSANRSNFLCCIPVLWESREFGFKVGRTYKREIWSDVFFKPLHKSFSFVDMLN